MWSMALSARRFTYNYARCLLERNFSPYMGEGESHSETFSLRTSPEFREETSDRVIRGPRLEVQKEVLVIKCLNQIISKNKPYDLRL